MNVKIGVRNPLDCDRFSDDDFEEHPPQPGAVVLEASLVLTAFGGGEIQPDTKSQGGVSRAGTVCPKADDQMRLLAVSGGRHLLRRQWDRPGVPTTIPQ